MLLIRSWTTEFFPTIRELDIVAETSVRLESLEYFRINIANENDRIQKLEDGQVSHSNLYLSTTSEASDDEI